MNKTALLLLLSSFLLLALVIAVMPLRRHTARIQWIIAMVLIVGSVFGYLQWGAMAQWFDYLKQQAISQRAQVIMKSLNGPQALIEKLKTHLQHQPNSARGWFLLGRLYASQDQWSEANQAFIKAVQLEPNNEPIMVNYAQSQWQLNHQVFTPEIRALFESLLKKNPNQPDALSMLAIDAYQQHQYQKAIDDWSKLLPLLPKASTESRAIRKAIVNARTHLRKEPT